MSIFVDNIRMTNNRLQLTLFIDKDQSETIEQIRQQFNPEQHTLIASHVTLCREDELQSIETIVQTLATLKYPTVTIDFGPEERFADGKGVLIPAFGDNKSFQKLRQIILQKVDKNPRRHEPHITLIHPRNATCTNDIFEQIQQTGIPSQLCFNTITLIEQRDGGKWKILQEFQLGKTD